jgi:thiazole/oxazole-forming peptide maturase SagD family component
MRMSITRRGPRGDGDAPVLLDRMLSPLCGLDQRLSVGRLSDVSPRVISIGAELAGVHVLSGAAAPKAGAYHIGGMGLRLEHAIVRALGETVERYAQLTAHGFGLHPIRFGTIDELRRSGLDLLAPEAIACFTPDQYATPGFPFAPFRGDMPLGWIEGNDLAGGPSTWVPAQPILVGYQAQPQCGEERIVSGVTTGTAAHRTRDRALLNAILELIQIDCAVGHWYSVSPSHPILPDERLAGIMEIIRERAGRSPAPQFVWLPSPDLPGFAIACLYRSDDGGVPALAVGLGCSLRLDEAVYKAWLEAAGVRQLAVLTLLQSETDRNRERGDGGFFDLDSNVAWYAAGNDDDAVTSRFAGGKPYRSGSLPADPSCAPDEAVDLLVDAFRAAGKPLYHWDLTPSDVASLGFVVERVWSPATFSLPLPSAPPAAHPRFFDYGGFDHARPHPYP